MKTGFSKICINPPLGVPMSGYYEERRVKGVLDDICVSAVSFDDGQRRALILAVDVCELSIAQTNKARKLVSERVGIDERAIFINCSHTHTGPSVEIDLVVEAWESEYNDDFYELLAKASERSFEDMKDSVFSVGNGKADGISFVRRYRMKNGNVQTNPGVDNPNILHALGVPDDRVGYLKIERENAEDIVLVSFGTHADTVGGEFISGDWPNVVTKIVETEFENTRCVFLTGVQGDVNHINPFPTAGERKGLDYDTFDGVPRGYAHTKYMGRCVAAAVLSGLDKTEPISCDKIAYGEKGLYFPSNRENHKIEEARRICMLHDSGRDAELPYEKMELTTVVAEAERICALENGPDGFEYFVGVLKLGDFVIATLPGECFVEIGRAIRRGYGKESIFVCCLTNGGNTYFPTSEAYSEGGYEARTSFLKTGADKILIDGMLSLLEECN